MDVTIERGRLVDAVEWAASAATAKSSLPILGGIEIAATGGGVAFTGTDQDRTNRADAAADVVEGGSAVVSARLLTAVAKAIPAGVDVRITDGAAGVEIAFLRARYVLPTLVGQYPVTPRLLDGPHAVFGPELGEMVRRGEPMARADDARGPVAGIWIEPDGEQVRVTCATRFRLITESLTVKGDLPEIPVCIPWGQLPAGLGDSAAPALYWLGNTVGISAGDGDLALHAWTQTVDEHSPVDQLVRLMGGAEPIARWDRDDLIAGVKAASVSIDKAVVLCLDIQGGVCGISARGGELAASVEIEVDAETDAEVWINPGYLRDVLTALPPGPLTLSRRTDVNPARAALRWSSDTSPRVGMTAPHEPPKAGR